MMHILQFISLFKLQYGVNSPMVHALGPFEFELLLPSSLTSAFPM
uniref:Uncharacterized protein n=1 Tax=Arundo donax TaxID=35708 RepID=A0A0A9BJ97_ARUDO